MNRINYQKQLERFLLQLQKDGKVPRLLLHSCCAPCSSYVLEYLSDYFSITVFYYNPNITQEEEYRHRVREEQRLIREMPVKNEVTFLEGNYEPQLFFRTSEGLEDAPEGGARCAKCFALRLEESARVAQEGRFDFFTTTLTISPLKNAPLLNQIGEEMGRKYEVPFLHSDFKKKNGYLRSLQLSEKYHLYRQDYCGCIFSRRERELQKEKKRASGE